MKKFNRLKKNLLLDVFCLHEKHKINKYKTSHQNEASFYQKHFQYLSVCPSNL